jgi:toxin ParE1/3/4
LPIQFLPQAERDLEGIADYIARDNPRRAKTFIREIRAHCRKITNAPLGYPERPEIRPGIRCCVHGNYLILFEANPPDVRIVRVRHGASTLDSLFG